MKYSWKSPTILGIRSIFVLLNLCFFFLYTATPIQAPTTPSYDDFPFDQHFDCSNYVALMFPQYESQGRNVTIEYGYNSNKSGHIWIAEDGEIIDGGDPVGINEEYNNCRLSFTSLEDAKSFFGEEEFKTDLADGIITNGIMLDRINDG